MQNMSKEALRSELKMRKFMEHYGGNIASIPRGTGKTDNLEALRRAVILDDMRSEYKSEIKAEVSTASVVECSKVMSSNLYKTNQLPIAHNLIKTVIYGMINGGLPRNKLKPWEFAFHKLINGRFTGRYALAKIPELSLNADFASMKEDYTKFGLWNTHVVLTATPPKPHTFGSYKHFHETIEKNLLNYDIVQYATSMDDIPLLVNATLTDIANRRRFAGMVTDETLAYLKLILA